jgi:protease-4
MAPKKVNSMSWDQKQLLVFIILPTLLGLIFSTLIPRPVIGTIIMTKTIDDAETDRIISRLQFAETQPDIRAVVLIQDCPGGTVSGTELIYLEVLKLRQTKPVVTMVQGMSASGSYYIAAASDYIIANPSSMIGNVGIVGNIPSKPRVYEEEYSTGPYKLWGWPQDYYIRLMDIMKATFLQAVLNGRGTKLQIAPDQVLRGEVYSAIEAARLGLIDTIGPQSDAIEKAADIAHISHYEVVDLDKKVTETKSTTTRVGGNIFELDENGNPTGKLREPGLYYLYLADMGGN